MNKRITEDSTNKTLLSLQEACTVYSCGYGTMKKWAEECGAIRKYGKRVFVIRPVMDEAITKQTPEASN